MAIVNSIVKEFTNIIAIDTATHSFPVCVEKVEGEGKVNFYIAKPLLQNDHKNIIFLCSTDLKFYTQKNPK